MEMSGEQRIPAPREVVWEALNDPEVLKASIPGCESLERNEADDGFDAKVRAKVGPVNARFGGAVVLSDINPPESYTISGEGKGGSAGFAKGSAKVQLADDGSDTLLSYTVDARVGGKLAQLGSRLIDGTARKMAEEFFTRFSGIVQERNGTAATSETAIGTGEPPPGGAPEPAPAIASADAAAADEPPTAPALDAPTEAAAQVGPQPTGPHPAEPATTVPRPAGATRTRGMSPMTWVALLVVIVVILLAVIL